MSTLVLGSFAFLAGLTLCGLAGSTIELLMGQRLSFREPFVSSRHLVRSLLVAAAAGPAMLTNDAVDAWRCGEVSTLFLLSCGLSAAGWALATGIVTLDLAVRALDLLS